MERADQDVIRLADCISVIENPGSGDRTVSIASKYFLQSLSLRSLCVEIRGLPAEHQAISTIIVARSNEANLDEDEFLDLLSAENNGDILCTASEIFSLKGNRRVGKEALSRFAQILLRDERLNQRTAAAVAFPYRCQVDPEASADWSEVIGNLLDREHSEAVLGAISRILRCNDLGEGDLLRRLLNLALRMNAGRSRQEMLFTWGWHWDRRDSFFNLYGLIESSREEALGIDAAIALSRLLRESDLWQMSDEMDFAETVRRLVHVYSISENSVDKLNILWGMGARWGLYSRPETQGLLETILGIERNERIARKIAVLIQHLKVRAIIDEALLREIVLG